MVLVGDPVRAGLVQSLARPGGNITGNSIISRDLGPKRLQLVKEIIPSAARVALLWNPDNVSSSVLLEQMREAAPGLGLAFTAVEARSVDAFAGAFAILARERPDAVMLTTTPSITANCRGSSTSYRRTGCRKCSRPGGRRGRGLMSYGAVYPELMRQGAFFVQKILQASSRPTFRCRRRSVSSW